ncbi:probable glycosyltransferase STELLO1 [Stylophora pistillata]|uniref:probable glycosyltransferase STELLO1 n=1 Tax=Stylophora pistillata TaxID=50429 RepID=UPI000C03C114|nr:probable glycosyltransferase STELLO1 [Stylophora pistillata]
MSRAMEKYPGYEGYLLIGDDVILNYWNLIGMDRNKIWEGPKVPILLKYTQPENWSWWNSPYGKSTCQKAYDDIWNLYNSSTTETLSNMSSLSVKGTVHSRSVLGNIKGSIDLSKQNRNWTFLCPRGRSDIFYLPRKFADEFKTLSDIFYKYRTFLEIAVPTMCRIIDKEDNFEYIPGIYMPGVGDKQSDFLWKTYNTTLAFIHPFKLRYEHDGAMNKALLKSWIMEYSNSLSIC